MNVMISHISVNKAAVIITINYTIPAVSYIYNL